MNNKYPSFISVRVAASILDTSTRMLTEYIRNGQLKATKRIGKWYVTHDDLYEFVHTSADSVSSEVYNGKRSKKQPSKLKTTPPTKAQAEGNETMKQRDNEVDNTLKLKELNSARRKAYIKESDERYEQEYTLYTDIFLAYVKSRDNPNVTTLPTPIEPVNRRLDGFAKLTELPNDNEPLTIDDLKDSEPTPTPIEPTEQITIDDLA